MTLTPWNDDQVRSLNEFQHCPEYHPFTCYNRHILVAVREGWRCPECAKAGEAYTQNWCHDFMAHWQWKHGGGSDLSQAGQSNTA